MQSGNTDINRLFSRFLDLRDQWSEAPEAFDWKPVQELAVAGAAAYNEGAGPSFHTLALDGVEHDEFHERFLAYLLAAGFDPFKLARTGVGDTVIPVIGHTGLAEAARHNPVSARMHASLQDLARQRFGHHLESENEPDEALRRIIEVCVESIPVDLLARFSPELARSRGMPTQPVNGGEGWLSDAEVIADGLSKAHG